MLGRQIGIKTDLKPTRMALFVNFSKTMTAE
jgi:hypothetical protein